MYIYIYICIYIYISIYIACFPRAFSLRHHRISEIRCLSVCSLVCHCRANSCLQLSFCLSLYLQLSLCLSISISNCLSVSLSLSLFLSLLSFCLYLFLPAHLVEVLWRGEAVHHPRVPDKLSRGNSYEQGIQQREYRFV